MYAICFDQIHPDSLPTTSTTSAFRLKISCTLSITHWVQLTASMSGGKAIHWGTSSLPGATS